MVNELQLNDGDIRIYTDLLYIYIYITISFMMDDIHNGHVYSLHFQTRRPHTREASMTPAPWDDK